MQWMPECCGKGVQCETQGGTCLSRSSNVESTEHDFPSEIDCIPKLRVMQAKSDHILPELLHVCRVGSESPDVG